MCVTSYDEKFNLNLMFLKTVKMQNWLSFMYHDLWRGGVTIVRYYNVRCITSYDELLYLNLKFLKTVNMQNWLSFMYHDLWRGGVRYYNVMCMTSYDDLLYLNLNVFRDCKNAKLTVIHVS